MSRMPRRRLHLLLRDLGSTAAFSAMAVSGQVPFWASGLFGVAVVFALLDRRPFQGKGPASALLLGLVALALYANVAFGRIDLVVAACTFAGLLAAHRMLAPPTPATDHQVHLTGILMVAGGAALSGELLFAPFLAAYAVLASLALGVGVLLDASGEDATLSYRAPLRQLGLGTLAAVLGGVVFFIAFPRLSWNVAGRRSGLGFAQAQTGFSAGVRLGGSGRIKTSPRVVLRATLKPDPLRPFLAQYWVGRTLDTFNGVEWSAPNAPERRAFDITLGHGGEGLVLAQVELLPGYGARTLVGLDTPVVFGSAVAVTALRPSRTRLVSTQNDQVTFELEAPSYTYQVYSRQSTLVAKLSEPERQRALQLPDNLDERVVALAARIAGTEANAEKKAALLEQYLRTQFDYTLELPGSPGDPLADFLFDTRAGHCEDFATALVILLRTQGIPARVIAGFYGGERVGDVYLLRAGDAHAWAQAFIPTRGWIRLDATPETGRSARPNRFVDWAVQSYTWVENWWQGHVLDYSFRDQAALAQRWTRVPPAQPLEPPTAWPTRLRRLCGVGAAGLLGYVLFRRRSRRLKSEASRLREEAEQLLWTTVRGRSKAARDDLETWNGRLTRTADPLASPVRQLTRRYLEARFGEIPLAPGERTHLRRALARAIRKRPSI